jgi:formate dehydrogenase subunit gamma
MKRYVLRYTAGQRRSHWTVAITFVLAALSGLSMFHPSMFFLADLFGGGTWARILHPFIGVVVFLVFMLTLFKFRRYNHMNENDEKWLKQWRDVVNNKEENLPEVGRYNAGQKIVFWVALTCLITLFVTGFVFWRPYFAGAFPIWLVRVATLLHAFAATIFIITIVTHVYAAIWVKGSFRAMIRGNVSEAWARKHHPAWFREIDH